MKITNILERINDILASNMPVISYANEIETLLKEITDEQLLSQTVNLIRGKVQLEACRAVIANGGRGIVAMATGAGKSKVGIMLAEHYMKNTSLKTGKIGLLVPTQKLRDENWKEEFYHWDKAELWEKVDRNCYASASKVSDRIYPIAILDEGHNITELSSSFFDNNEVENVVILTATPPESEDKKILLSERNLRVVYHLSLENAIKLGFVAPYDITVIKVPLNEVDKNVKAGSKTRPFMTTEKASYSYLDTEIKFLSENYMQLGMADRNKKRFLELTRMNLIYKLKSKTEAAKYLIENVIPKEDRFLTFCGSKEQADSLGEHRFHSSSGSKSYNLFKEGKINELHCVKAINEGHNLPNVDCGIIVQINSKQKDILQRIGRLIRFRPGHKAKVFIIVSEGTQDEVWLNSALEGTNQERVSYYGFEEYKALQESLV